MKRILFIIIFLSATIISLADDAVFSPPSEPTLVADYANVFADGERRDLTDKLNAFSRETSTQILVYTTNDLHGYDIADFGQRLGEGWGVGQNGFDNGIVIVYKPKTDSTSGEVTIQTGYGIEPLIPDATCKRIIEVEMIPCFREGLIYDGIDKAVELCMAFTKGEFPDGNWSNNADDSPIYGLSLLIGLLLLGYPIYAAITKKTRGKRATFGEYLLQVLMFLLQLLLSGGGGSGSTYGGSSRGSSRSSGFGGYGGGHFGGGGASGKW